MILGSGLVWLNILDCLKFEGSSLFSNRMASQSPSASPRRPTIPNEMNSPVKTSPTKMTQSSTSYYPPLP